MKVRLQSNSLLFTVLSIVLNVPISRVRRKADVVVRKPPSPAETAQDTKRWNRVAL